MCTMTFWTDETPQWVAFKAERERFEAALAAAIAAAAAIASNPDSPLPALSLQRYADALPRLVSLRSQVRG